ncbi:hypothetical protein [Massilicoli timonensis]|nr:hypothetical protein [Massilicoli timonensis]
MEEKLNKNILSSSHINFLFGVGVNRSAFPQLKGFIKTIMLFYLGIGGF